MLHASMLNSRELNCWGSIASIIGVGLHDEEITPSFAKIIHRKIKAQETGTAFQLSAENLSAVKKTQST